MRTVEPGLSRHGLWLVGQDRSGQHASLAPATPHHPHFSSLHSRQVITQAWKRRKNLGTCMKFTPDGNSCMKCCSLSPSCGLLDYRAVFRLPRWLQQPPRLSNIPFLPAGDLGRPCTAQSGERGVCTSRENCSGPGTQLIATCTFLKATVFSIMP